MVEEDLEKSQSYRKRNTKVWCIHTFQNVPCFLNTCVDLMLIYLSQILIHDCKDKTYITLQGLRHAFSCTALNIQMRTIAECCVCVCVCVKCE